MKKQLIQYQERVNHTLDLFLKNQKNCPKELLEAIKYSTLNNGKRLRPALVYATAAAHNISLEKVDSLAASIELIHSYSLVHDDLPAMDDDDLRRGLPTCHIQYNEATAILVGDAQQTLAFEIITEDTQLTDSQKIQAIRLLSIASGPQGMIAGQFIDFKSEGHLPSLASLKQMHLQKTGCLIQSALLLGCLTATNYPQQKTQINEIGKSIGLAFQVHDDILDIEGNTEELGKPQGSDEANNKSTYPKLLGLAESKHYRDTLIKQAQNDLSLLKLNSPFLIQLTDYIAKRSH